MKFIELYLFDYIFYLLPKLLIALIFCDNLIYDFKNFIEFGVIFFF
ncbi:MAG: hypothetical protein MSH23_01005 [Campylobacter lanienae]|nr:hypothetical protein [Campylobacter lanienae]